MAVKSFHGSIVMYVTWSGRASNSSLLDWQIVILTDKASGPGHMAVLFLYMFHLQTFVK